MNYIVGNRDVSFKLLQESGMYSKELLDQLRGNNFSYLKGALTTEQRANKYFMEPLLYAVKNERGTYEIYRYYSDNLQENIELAAEIVRYEPDIIEDTSISDDETFMIQLIKVNPEVIIYMSEDLKQDSEFIEKLCKLDNKEVTRYIASECKVPDVIIENPNLANNPEFIKEACKSNEELIEYITEHTEDFSSESLKAAKGVLVENTRNSAVLGFQNELEQLQEKKLSGNTEEIKIREEQVKRHIKSFEKEEDISPRKARLMLKLCNDLDEEHRKKLEQIVKLDEAVLAKQKEEQDKKILPKDIEKLAENSKLSEVQAEPTAIREQITLEREQEAKENQEIGEM